MRNMRKIKRLLSKFYKELQETGANATWAMRN